MKTLFVCKGNVGRSQMAEALMHKLHPDIEVVSAGTAVSGPEQPIGELQPGIKEVLEVMQEEGVDVSGYVRKQLTEEMVRNADNVVVIMEDTEPLPEYLVQSPKVIRWNVPDPKGKDLEFTREVKDRIKEFVLMDKMI